MITIRTISCFFHTILWLHLHKIVRHCALRATTCPRFRDIVCFCFTRKATKNTDGIHEFVHTRAFRVFVNAQIREHVCFCFTRKATKDTDEEHKFVHTRAFRAIVNAQNCEHVCFCFTRKATKCTQEEHNKCTKTCYLCFEYPKARKARFHDILLIRAFSDSQ
jgi:hypothetical protein